MVGKKDELEAVSVDEVAEASAPSLIVVSVHDDGSFQVTTQGKVGVLETPTILRIAAKRVEKDLGI